MTGIKPILSLLVTFILLLHAAGQDLPAHSEIAKTPVLPSPVTPARKSQVSILRSPVPVSRWLLSFNPFGLLEAPRAYGAGIGYRLNKNTEIWTEISLLQNRSFTPVGPAAGIRQILQLKKFLFKDRNLFVAAEIRYKNYSYFNTANFRNTAAGDTMVNVRYTSYHYIFGGALQAGYRTRLSRSGRVQAELTAGIGIKNKEIQRPWLPAGYKYLHTSVDPNIVDLMETPGPAVYFPGSLRVLYIFGKRLG